MNLVKTHVIFQNFLRILFPNSASPSFTNNWTNQKGTHSSGLVFSDDNLEIQSDRSQNRESSELGKPHGEHINRRTNLCTLFLSENVCRRHCSFTLLVKNVVLLKEPGPPLIWEGGPVCFCRFCWRFLAQNQKFYENQIETETVSWHHSQGFLSLYWPYNLT